MIQSNQIEKSNSNTYNCNCKNILFIAKDSDFSKSLYNGIQSYINNWNNKGKDIQYNLQKEYINIKEEFKTSDDKHTKIGENEIRDSSEKEIIKILNDNKNESCFIIRPVATPSKKLADKISELLLNEKIIILMDLNLPEDIKKNKTNLPFFVGSNFEEGGKIIGNQIVELVDKNKKDNTLILMFEGPTYKDSIEVRCKSINKILKEKELDGITQKVNLPSMNFKDTTIKDRISTKFNNVKNTQKEYIIIYCGNDAIAEYIIENKDIKEYLDKASRVIFIGYDGIKDPSNKDNYKLDDYDCSYITVDVFPDKQGEKAGEIAIKAISKEECTKEFYEEYKLGRRLRFQKNKCCSLDEDTKNLISKTNYLFFDIGATCDINKLIIDAYKKLHPDDEIFKTQEFPIYNTMLLKQIYAKIKKASNQDKKFFYTSIYNLIGDSTFTLFKYFNDIITNYKDKEYHFFCSNCEENEFNIKSKIFTGISSAKITDDENEIILIMEEFNDLKKDLKVLIDDKKNENKIILFGDNEDILKQLSDLKIKEIGIEHKFNSRNIYSADNILNVESNVGLFVGLCGQDIVYYINNDNDIPQKDQKSRICDYREAIGGPAANAAITYSLLGGKSILVSCIGNSPIGIGIKKKLNSMGIEVYDLIDKKEMSPNISCIFINKNGKRTIISGQTNFEINKNILDDDKIKYLTEHVDFCLYDCNMGEIPNELLDGLVSKKKPIVLDAGSLKECMKTYFHKATEIICSHNMLREIKDDKDLIPKGKKTQIAFTNGGEDIELGWPSDHGDTVESIKIEHIDNVVDTLGAGDTLHGAFCYYRYVKKLKFKEALESASVVATHKTQFRGVIEGVEKFLEDKDKNKNTNTSD